MTIIALKLLTEASARGWTFAVDHGDDDGPVKVAGGKRAWQAVRDVGEARVTFYDGGGQRIGWAYLMVPGPMTCADDESLVDYSVAREGHDKGAFEVLCDALIEEVL